MVRVENSKTVNAAQKEIFALITDFEKLPSRFPNRYRSLKVLQRSGNTVTVEEDVMAAGREFHQITRHQLEPNSKLRSEVIEGDTKGTRVIITLEPESSERTKVSVDADLKLGKMGSMLGVFAKGKIKEGLERMIDEFENKAKSV
ncbi:MAG TPA: SRPBCC family protein [Nitrososphaera sp.]|jgi:ribosome-associated toxin RatA of RatAB toxin-antitoxin module